jgi:hypothetical protein
VGDGLQRRANAYPAQPARDGVPGEQTVRGNSVMRGSRGLREEELVVVPLSTSGAIDSDAERPERDTVRRPCLSGPVTRRRDAVVQLLEAVAGTAAAAPADDNAACIAVSLEAVAKIVWLILREPISDALEKVRLVGPCLVERPRTWAPFCVRRGYPLGTVAEYPTAVRIQTSVFQQVVRILLVTDALVSGAVVALARTIRVAHAFHARRRVQAMGSPSPAAGVSA